MISIEEACRKDYETRCPKHVDQRVILGCQRCFGPLCLLCVDEGNPCPEGKHHTRSHTLCIPNNIISDYLFGKIVLFPDNGTHHGQSVKRLWHETKDRLMEQKMNLERLLHRIKVVQESEKERYISDIETIQGAVKMSSVDQVCLICFQFLHPVFARKYRISNIGSITHR